MPSFLLELFSEEIPARMQEAAAKHLADTLFGECARAFGSGVTLDAGDWRRYVTPRRLAVSGLKLPESQPDSTVEKKGPKTSAPQAAIDGFLRSTGLAQDQLEKRLLGKDETYFAVSEQKGRPTAELLKEIVEKTLIAFPWPKSMRWGSGETRWVRPLHSILCLLDERIIPVEFAGLKAGNITYGHRFMAPAAITIGRAEDYEAALEKAFVMADPQARKAHIRSQAEAKAAECGLTLKRDDGLLAEVTGLAEWPVVLAGKIDAQFMDLPPEVLISEMRAHQKYFALENEGVFADTFLITANTVTEDAGLAVIAGNERVLRARLSDGRFFWDQDRKKPLTEWAKGLEGVTFHAKIGTMAQKVERIAVLAVTLAPYIPGTNKILVQRAAQLCKADLITGMIGEFPELQGVMGRYYALVQQENPSVADAIRDHYLPLGPDSPVPDNPISICIALADKLDTLVSMWAAGEKPTGSKDPFALRRAALGIIRIILHHRVRLNLRELFLQPFLFSLVHINIAEQKWIKGATEFDVYKEPYKASAALMNLAQEAASLEKLIRGQKALETGMLNNIDELFIFFTDRLKIQLKDKGIRHDLIVAVITGGDYDLVRIVARAQALKAFLATDDGSNLLAAYRRAGNIVAIEEKKDKQTYVGAVMAENLAEQEELALFAVLEKIGPDVQTALAKEDFTAAMQALASLRAPVDAFFDKVMVNAEDKEVRVNRLNLLARIRATLDAIADFSQIEGL